MSEHTESLTDRLTRTKKAEISCLQDLHVLSQTESLMLDQLDYEGLDAIVESKERVVARIVELQHVFAVMIGQIQPDSRQISGAQRETLRGLGRDAAQLLTRVSEVDGRNRLRLEALRSDAVESLHLTQQQQRLQRTYQT